MKINSGQVALLVLVLIVAYGLYGRYRRTKIITDYTITHGVIDDLGYHRGKFIASGTYSFFVNGEEYTGPIPRQSVCEENMYFDTTRNDKYTVVYYRPDPFINKILTSEELFNEHEVPFTDTDREALIPYFICE
jgi:hypothetical protein